MKRMLAVVSVAVLAGCAMPVPSTRMVVKIGGTKFEWRCPKQFVGTNIVAEVSTNGVARFAIGSVASINEPAVVKSSYAGQALVIEKIDGLVQHSAEAAAKGAVQGMAAGAK